MRIRVKRIRGRRLTGPVGMREGRALGSREALEPHAQRVLKVCQALRLGARLRVRRRVVFVGPAHSLRGRRRGTLSLSLSEEAEVDSQGMRQSALGALERLRGVGEVGALSCGTGSLGAAVRDLGGVAGR